jgi:dTDP-4-amino-4,6-dideoxygalactose transaminase
MILANDFKRQWQDLRNEFIACFEAVGESGWYVLGNEVARFEADLANAWGSRAAVGVASGLDALEISLRVLGCQPGEKVLTTPLSAFATTLAILKCNAVPVFVDCDEYGLIDLNECRRVLGKDRQIRFLLPVHLYGHCLELAELERLRDNFSLQVVEDCAQSILASSNGTLCGSVGQLAATSFYPTKNLGAIGDGGAILTNTASYDQLARALRDYGQTEKYVHTYRGFNSRLDELQAALLRRVALPNLNRWTDRRKIIADQYCREIRNRSIRIPGKPPHSNSVWHLFPVFVDASRKADFLSHLRQNEISAGEHYPIAIPNQPAIRDVAFITEGTLSRAYAMCAGEISLPIHPYLTNEEAERVIEACNRWKG